MTSVTVNQPLIQTSETHSSPHDDSVGGGWEGWECWEGSYYGRAETAGTGHTQ